MKIWTTLTGADDVSVHLTRDAAVNELVKFLNGCEPDEEATVENWQDVLAGLNASMEEAGEAGYNAVLKEHDLPAPRLVVEVNGDVVHRLHTDSPFLDGVEAAVITTGLDLNDEGPEVMQIAVGGGEPGEFVGGLMSVEKATDWNVDEAYDAIEAKSHRRGMGM